MSTQAPQTHAGAVDEVINKPDVVSPISKEIVIGFVGYAGAGCSTASSKFVGLLNDMGYDEVHRIKMSDLIKNFYKFEVFEEIKEGKSKGAAKLSRAVKLQNLGDKLRSVHGDYAIASLAVKNIISKRGNAEVGDKRNAFLIDSIKHSAEVNFFRDVYGQSFRLVAVHGERSVREARLIGNSKDECKFAGADQDDIISYIDRDEKDSKNSSGQQVRDAFYLADYFLDNNLNNVGGKHLNADAERLLNLMLGGALVRPRVEERAMYYAYAAGMQSSCLSRQVGAVVLSADDEIIGTGTNDVPKFGGGVYNEGSKPDARCHKWEWSDGEMVFKGCHNDRKKDQLRGVIAQWLASELSDQLAERILPPTGFGTEMMARQRSLMASTISSFFTEDASRFDRMPGVKDLIEFSRAIHAEMSAILSAARSGHSPKGGRVFCTTYPCHNCARHMVSAGIKEVFYVEPYVKSLALELHSDAIRNEVNGSDGHVT